jgi:hypothetical protein
MLGVGHIRARVWGYAEETTLPLKRLKKPEMHEDMPRVKRGTERDISQQTMHVRSCLLDDG